ncbi:C-X-C motif chemokine 10-like isoform X2 [Dendrobates tinctorius]|uniref:C-X-C motif chemokine 10-like isoform X2 n=1 Tax=Dendrobates tinctorius TaxID=92724 RepID=UPI003CC9FC49
MQTSSFWEIKLGSTVENGHRAEELTKVAVVTADWKMTAKLLAVVCLLGLQFWVHQVVGSQLDRVPGGRCRCLKVTTDAIPKHLIKKIEIIPLRVYCPNIEIVVTTKADQFVCIDAEAKWFKNMLPRLMQLKKQNQERRAKLQSTQE